MTELNCTEYVMYDWDEPYTPCKCPMCGAFLKWDSKIMKCKKCGTSLIPIPDVDEETGKEEEWGKICPISKKDGGV